MRFIKMHGCGNDYVLVDGFEEKVGDPNETAKSLCNRRYGIGADGFIIVEAAARAHGRMRIFNSDGSEAEMCGNGIRCVAKFLFEKIVDCGDEIIVDTLAGKRKITRYRSGEAGTYEVDMGRPLFFNAGSGGLVHASQPEEIRVDIDGESVTGIPVSVGNPHFVVFIDQVEAYPVTTIGPMIEQAPCFKNGTNVEFVELHGKDRFKQRTWERGAGETLACGTGATAVAAATSSLKKLKTPMTADLTGGELTLSVTNDGSILMRGEAIEVFRGEV